MLSSKTQHTFIQFFHFITFSLLAIIRVFRKEFISLNVYFLLGSLKQLKKATRSSTKPYENMAIMMRKAPLFWTALFFMEHGLLLNNNNLLLCESFTIIASPPSKNSRHGHGHGHGHGHTFYSTALEGKTKATLNEADLNDKKTDISLSDALSGILDEEFGPSESEASSADSNLDSEYDDDDDDDDTPPTIKAKKETKKKTTTTTPKTKKRKPKPKKERTKAQIKKLKFLMSEDVEKLIQDKNVTAIHKAQENIDRLQKLYQEEGNSDYKPRILNYNVLIRAYGKLASPEQAEKILMDLQRKYEETNDEDFRPRTITYTEVIDAYGKSKQRNSAEKAEEILMKMFEEAENDDGTMDESIAPSSITCDAVLNAWAKKGNRIAAERAETILERMEYLRLNGNVKVQPTSFSFATVIGAWGRARAGSKIEGKENAERAHFIFTRMKDFMKSIGREKDGDQYTKDLHPDTVVFNTVIDAWSKSNDPQAGTKAEELLFEMEELQRIGSNFAAPDAITFNSVINCHATSGHLNGAKRAENVLKKMEIASKNGSDVAPNVRTYNTVLKAYSKRSSSQGAAKRAEVILMYMLRSEDDSIQPDVFSFSTTLDCWAKSKEAGKAEKTWMILQKMLEFYKSSGNEKIKPNEVSYNTVLNACAFSAFTPDEEKKRALKIAVTAFNEMQNSKSVKPDAITYGMLIKCIANLVPRGKTRTKMASDLFTNCKKAGLVNGLVFDEIRRAVPGNVMAGLLGRIPQKNRRKPLSQLELRDLPRSWRSNVVEAKPKGKRQKKKREEPKRDDSSNKKKKDIASFEGDPIRPMRHIVEQSWQSGRDV